MSRRSCCDDRGFSLIEALVALAIVAAVLASIGAVIATTVKATRSIDQRIALTGAAESLLASLPARDLPLGRQTGELAGQRWRIDVAPMAADGAAAGRWRPVSVSLRLQAPGGPAMQLTTVRLVPRAAQ